MVKRCPYCGNLLYEGTAGDQCFNSECPGNQPIIVRAVSNTSHENELEIKLAAAQAELTAARQEIATLKVNCEGWRESYIARTKQWEDEGLECCKLRQEIERLKEVFSERKGYYTSQYLKTENTIIRQCLEARVEELHNIIMELAAIDSKTPEFRL
jgi:predicted  nucleic acid-binding Zn-ribbon protein